MEEQHVEARGGRYYRSLVQVRTGRLVSVSGNTAFVIKFDGETTIELIAQCNCFRLNGEPIDIALNKPLQLTSKGSTLTRPSEFFGIFKSANGATIMYSFFSRGETRYLDFSIDAPTNLNFSHGFCVSSAKGAINDNLFYKPLEKTRTIKASSVNNKLFDKVTDTQQQKAENTCKKAGIDPKKHPNDYSSCVIDALIDPKNAKQIAKGMVKNQKREEKAAISVAKDTIRTMDKKDLVKFISKIVVSEEKKKAAVQETKTPSAKTVSKTLKALSVDNLINTLDKIIDNKKVTVKTINSTKKKQEKEQHKAKNNSEMKQTQGVSPKVTENKFKQEVQKITEGKSPVKRLIKTKSIDDKPITVEKKIKSKVAQESLVPKKNVEKRTQQTSKINFGKNDTTFRKRKKQTSTATKKEAKPKKKSTKVESDFTQSFDSKPVVEKKKPKTLNIESQSVSTKKPATSQKITEGKSPVKILIKTKSVDDKSITVEKKIKSKVAQKSLEPKKNVEKRTQQTSKIKFGKRKKQTSPSTKKEAKSKKADDEEMKPKKNSTKVESTQSFDSKPVVEKKISPVTRFITTKAVSTKSDQETKPKKKKEVEAPKKNSKTTSEKSKKQSKKSKKQVEQTSEKSGKKNTKKVSKKTTEISDSSKKTSDIKETKPKKGKKLVKDSSEKKVSKSVKSSMKTKSKKEVDSQQDIPKKTSEGKETKPKKSAISSKSVDSSPTIKQETKPKKGSSGKNGNVSNETPQKSKKEDSKISYQEKKQKKKVKKVKKGASTSSKKSTSETSAKSKKDSSRNEDEISIPSKKSKGGKKKDLTSSVDAAKKQKSKKEQVQSNDESTTIQNKKKKRKDTSTSNSSVETPKKDKASKKNANSEDEAPKLRIPIRKSRQAQGNEETPIQSKKSKGGKKKIPKVDKSNKSEKSQDKPKLRIPSRKTSPSRDDEEVPKLRIPTRGQSNSPKNAPKQSETSSQQRIESGMMTIKSVDSVPVTVERTQKNTISTPKVRIPTKKGKDSKKQPKTESISSSQNESAIDLASERVEPTRRLRETATTESSGKKKKETVESAQQIPSEEVREVSEPALSSETSKPTSKGKPKEKKSNRRSKRTSHNVSRYVPIEKSPQSRAVEKPTSVNQSIKTIINVPTPAVPKQKQCRPSKVPSPDKKLISQLSKLKRRNEKLARHLKQVTRFNQQQTAWNRKMSQSLRSEHESKDRLKHYLQRLRLELSDLERSNQFQQNQQPTAVTNDNQQSIVLNVVGSPNLQ
ncbi:predicted protein [Naegleria gruberi]|uniref:Predicted protein n=1 Tax=Naegleria gruberi TaxID=5762 RepID=D2VIT9_NAEGR|nr:uncharacterized protein NAEGRDRAFT_49892 [Naegleria gruberi]EFC43332.1 predicted protein [Naegleria gruberi]|eukprot:XP_002676076.1 predicted protein [Naegleria gruberi strain NEG-M]